MFRFPTKASERSNARLFDGQPSGQEQAFKRLSVTERVLLAGSILTIVVLFAG